MILTAPKCNLQAFCHVRLQGAVELSLHFRSHLTQLRGLSTHSRGHDSTLVGLQEHPRVGHELVLGRAHGGERPRQEAPAQLVQAPEVRVQEARQGGQSQEAPGRRRGTGRRHAVRLGGVVPVSPGRGGRGCRAHQGTRHAGVATRREERPQPVQALGEMRDHHLREAGFKDPREEGLEVGPHAAHARGEEGGRVQGVSQCCRVVDVRADIRGQGHQEGVDAAGGPHGQEGGGVVEAARGGGKGAAEDGLKLGDDLKHPKVASAGKKCR